MGEYSFEAHQAAGDQPIDEQDERPFILRPNDNGFYDLLGILNTWKADSSVNGVGVDKQPPSGGPPEHAHSENEEILYVLEGDFTVQTGDRMTKISQGSLVYIPKGVKHTYKNEGPDEGSVLVAFAPGGISSVPEGAARPSAQEPRNPSRLIATPGSGGADGIVRRLLDRIYQLLTAVRREG
jgi:mannose-6-phosphate isomerase-like protein (cupin superfamily)